MKYLLYGHKGWIGSQVKELLDNPILGKARLDNYEQVRQEILHYNPDRVITTTGRTHGEGCNTIDYLEDNLEINLRDNLLGPLNLAKICDRNQIHLTYLGTGCIFNYDENHNFTEGFKEFDKPNFFGSAYSTVKGMTDQLIRSRQVLNVRIRMPIVDYDHPRNFITKITNYEKICSIPNSMTVLPELLPIMIDMSKRGINGTINLTNPGVISHNEILEIYRDIIDKNFKWKNFTIEEQDQILKSKRSNNYLNTTKLQNLYPQVKNIKDSIKDILNNYNKI